MTPKINPEFLPLIEWWEKDGKQYVIGLLVAAVVIGGWYGWKHYRTSVRTAASDALASAYTTEEIEDAVAKYSGTAAGGALRLRLAKSYFDAGRYEEALSTYEALVSSAPDGFADIPVVGRAQCLEAMSRFAEAQKAFDEFAEANPSNYLALTAQLGAARCIAQAGDRTKALARIASIKAANKNNEMATARIEAVEDAIKRFEAAVDKPAPEAKPEAKPAVETKPVEVKPAAEAKPAEAKPAPAAKAESKPEAKK